jgi:hypothetical protein
MGAEMILALGLAMELAGFIVLWKDVVRVHQEVVSGREELLGKLDARLKHLVSETRREADSIRRQSTGPGLFPRRMEPKEAIRLLDRTIDLAASSGMRAISGLSSAVAHMHQDEKAHRERAKQTLIVSRWALYFVGGGFLLQVIYLVAVAG